MRAWVQVYCYQRRPHWHLVQNSGVLWPGRKPGLERAGKRGSMSSLPQIMSSSEEIKPSTRERRELPSETYVVKAMPSVLGTGDMTITAVMALFLLTNAVSGAGGGSVSLVYLALGAIVFFVPCIVATIQLGVLLPNEGSLYNWTVRATNRFWGLFIGLCFWLSGALAVTTAGSAFIATLQWMNAGWVNQPWQQGVVILALTWAVAFIGMQRMRMIQNVINLVFWVTLLSVALVGAAAVVWLATGHHSVTNFADNAGWVPGPATFFLFAIITLNYIGASGPMNMAGELLHQGNEKALKNTIRRHLLIGGPLVVLLYAIVTTSVLIVRGSSVGPFDGFIAVEQTLGKIPAAVAAGCFLAYLFAAMLFYSYASARVIMSAGIDQFFPARFGKLNKHRAPANAAQFHAMAVTIVVVFIYILIPALITVGGSATTTTTEFFTVVAASCTLVWTVATTFFFVDLIFLYRRNRDKFRRERQFPLWVIWLSVAVGGAACLATIVGVLVYPWIPLIRSDSWPFLVGGLTAAIMLVTSIVAMFLSGEADFERFRGDHLS
jgi:amino acid transporter